ncbi:MAG: YHS domain-containing (seleno)protein [Pseudomonadota bacterium]
MKIKLFFLTLILSLTSAFAHADVSTSTDENDVILAGHDAVAYFKQSKAVTGSAKFTAQHEGAVYWFSSAANRDEFRKTPEKYAPAYGGYCAFGASLGKKFAVDGKAFEVVEDRLYVNKNLEVYDTWRKDIPNNIVKAEGQWLKIHDIPANKL